MAFTIFYMIIGSLGDRLRGTYSWASILFAIALSSQFDFNIGLILGIFAGEVFGWGNPMGSYFRDVPMTTNPKDQHGWQKTKLLKTNIPAAMAVRGIIWGALASIGALIGGLQEWWIFLPSLTASFLLGPWLVHRVFNTVFHKYKRNIILKVLLGYFKFQGFKLVPNTETIAIETDEWRASELVRGLFTVINILLLSLI